MSNISINFTDLWMALVATLRKNVQRNSQQVQLFILFFRQLGKTMLNDDTISVDGKIPCSIEAISSFRRHNYVVLLSRLYVRQEVHLPSTLSWEAFFSMLYSNPSLQAYQGCQ